MRIHVITPGFTKEVYQILAKIGADRIVAVHSAFSTKETREKVDNVIKEVEHLTGQKVDFRVVKGEKFEEFIKYFIDLFKEFSETDQIFIHLGGGERFLGIAAMYASFFVNRNIKAISTIEVTGKDKPNFTYDVLPSLPLYKIGKTKHNILRVLKESPGLTLTEIFDKLKGVSKPAIHTHLTGLSNCGFIELEEGTKKYKLSSTGSLMLERD
jgi:CRISPR locus-related DNA-binding protein